MNQTALFYGLLTIVVWGVIPILDKWITGRLDSFTIVLLRSVFLGLITLSYGAVWGKLPQRGQIPGSLYAFLFALAALMALGLFSYFQALTYGETSRVIPLTSTYPLVTLFLAVLFLHEPLTLRKIAGVLLILCGIGFLVEKPAKHPGGLQEGQVKQVREGVKLPNHRSGS